jgi:hypothetical protein
MTQNKPTFLKTADALAICAPKKTVKCSGSTHRTPIAQCRAVSSAPNGRKNPDTAASSPISLPVPRQMPALNLHILDVPLSADLTTPSSLGRDEAEARHY